VSTSLTTALLSMALASVCTHLLLSLSSIIWYYSGGALMLQSYEGNRRSDVSLAMHHKTLWFISSADSKA